MKVTREDLNETLNMYNFELKPGNWVVYKGRLLYTFNEEWHSKEFVEDMTTKIVNYFGKDLVKVEENKIHLKEHCLGRIEQLEEYNNIINVVKEVFAKVGITILDNDQFTDNYYLRDYFCFPKIKENLPDFVLIDKSDYSTYIDGRMNNVNCLVIEDFWDFSVDDDCEYYENVFPNSVCVTRKGKDFYVYPEFETGEVGDCCRTWGGGYDLYYNELDYFYQEHLFEAEELVEHLNGVKKDLELKSELYNLLKIGCEHDYFFYCDTAPDEVCELFNSGDLKHEIYNIDYWSVSPKAGLHEYLIDCLPDNYSLKAFQEKLLSYKVIEDDGVFAVDFGKKYGLYHFYCFEEINEEMLRKVLNKRVKERIERIKNKVANRELLEKAKNVFVGLEDSYNSGNCEFGTKKFCMDNHINLNVIGALRGDVLLNIRFDRFTIGAVRQAIRRLKNEI